MAIRDWPTWQSLRPRSITFGSTTEKSAYRGAYTGDEDSIAHLADRLTCTLTLGPCLTEAEAAQRAAWLHELDSTGDWVRFGPLHRATPQLGNLAGNITVASTTLAGARSVPVVGARAAPNLLRNSGFELDSNADGLADSLTPFNEGAVAGLTYLLDVGNASGYGQQVNVAALGTSWLDRAGFSFPGVPVSPGQVMALSADIIGTPGLGAVISANDFATFSQQALTLPAGGWQRVTLVHTVAAGAASSLVVGCWIARNPGSGAVGARFDNFQLELAATATPYAGLPRAAPGDWLAIGGNLVQVASAGAVGTDAGACTLPLVLPLQRDVAAGAVVSVAAPVGVWQLATEGMAFDYSRRAVQAGLALPFRQRIV